MSTPGPNEPEEPAPEEPTPAMSAVRGCGLLIVWAIATLVILLVLFRVGPTPVLRCDGGWPLTALFPPIELAATVIISAMLGFQLFGRAAPSTSSAVAVAAGGAVILTGIVGIGWRGRIRTFDLLIQSQAPYRLATRQ